MILATTLLFLSGTVLIAAGYYLINEPQPPRWLIVVAVIIGALGFLIIIHGTILLLGIL